MTKLAAHKHYTERNKLKWRRRLRSRLSQDSDFVPPLLLKAIANDHSQAILPFSVFFIIYFYRASSEKTRPKKEYYDYYDERYKKVPFF